jgi:transposase
MWIMEPMYYIELDVHKPTINYCVKASGGKIYTQGSLPATRMDLDLWMKTLPHPWSGAIEATMFTRGSTSTSSHLRPP